MKIINIKWCADEDVSGLPDNIEIQNCQYSSIGIIIYCLENYGFRPKDFDVCSECLVTYLNSNSEVKEEVIGVVHKAGLCSNKMELKVFNALLNKKEELSIKEVLGFHFILN